MSSPSGTGRDLRKLPEEERMTLAVKGPTFIFDGVCNLCNTCLRFVDDHLRPDADVKYMWTNHPDTLKVLAKYNVSEEDINKSWGYLKGGHLYRGSTAWLMGLQELRAPWSWGYYLIYVPECIREFVLPSDSEIGKEFRTLKFLNQYDKARYFERLAEDQGVLHLLKVMQESTCPANPPATVPSRVKSFVSTLDLSQRKIEKLAEVSHTVWPIRSSLSDYKLNFVLRDHYVVPKDILNFVCKHFELPSSSSSSSTEGSQSLCDRDSWLGWTLVVVLISRKDSRLTTEQIVHELKPLEQRFRLLFSCDNKQLQFLACTVPVKQLEDLLTDKLHISPTKPIAGSTLEKTNVLCYTGKDCKRILDNLDTIAPALRGFEKGEDACKVLAATRSRWMGSNLLGQMAMWNWQYSPEETSESVNDLTPRSPTPRPKRKRPQLALSPRAVQSMLMVGNPTVNDSLDLLVADPLLP
ncbi:hypothetical protein FOL47_010752, partial [Perkinsus chesapeaki]